MRPKMNVDAIPDETLGLMLRVMISYFGTKATLYDFPKVVEKMRDVLKGVFGIEKLSYNDVHFFIALYRLNTPYDVKNPIVRPQLKKYSIRTYVEFHDGHEEWLNDMECYSIDCVEDVLGYGDDDNFSIWDGDLVDSEGEEGEIVNMDHDIKEIK